MPALVKEVETRKPGLLGDSGALEPMLVGLLARRPRGGAQKACEEAD